MDTPARPPPHALRPARGTHPAPRGPARKRSLIRREYIEKELAVTRKALGKVRIAPPGRTFGRRIAENFLEMARAYFSDAGYFLAGGDLVNALACVNYAHGWLDAGARLGLFDVGGDDTLFTLLE